MFHLSGHRHLASHFKDLSADLLPEIDAFAEFGRWFTDPVLSLGLVRQRIAQSPLPNAPSHAAMPSIWFLHQLAVEQRLNVRKLPLYVGELRGSRFALLFQAGYLVPALRNLAFEQSGRPFKEARRSWNCLVWSAIASATRCSSRRFTSSSGNLI